MHNCLKFSAVLDYEQRQGFRGIDAVNSLTDFGTISLNSSIFSRPAGVSPILMSINTTGRVLDDIFSQARDGS